MSGKKGVCHGGRNILGVFRRNTSSFLKERLSKKVIVDMIDFCFANGPKSLTDEKTWDGLLKVLAEHVSQ